MKRLAAGVAKAAVLCAVAGFIVGYLVCLLALPSPADEVDRALGFGACAAVAGLVGAAAGAIGGRRAPEERGEEECETRS